MGKRTKGKNRNNGQSKAKRTRSYSVTGYNVREPLAVTAGRIATRTTESKKSVDFTNNPLQRRAMDVSGADPVKQRITVTVEDL